MPCRFGAFSFTAEADLRKLVARGFLEDVDKAWRITAAGLEAVEGFPALVAETCRRHPYPATRSEIAAGRLFTIGYEGRSLEGCLNVLLRAGVSMLCDVRRNPLSRKFGFSKKTLAGACEAVGIRYEHLPELGIASEERRNLKTPADYEALFDAYKSKTLPLQTSSLSRIAGWIRAGAGPALICFEADPLRCHRRCVAEAVEGLIDLPATSL